MTHHDRAPALTPRRPSRPPEPASPQVSRVPTPRAPGSAAASRRWSRSTARHADPGHFGPDSVSWRIHHDPASIVGGIRALAFQSLHPEVMLGFAQRHRRARRRLGPPVAHRPLRQRDHLRHRPPRPTPPPPAYAGSTAPSASTVPTGCSGCTAAPSTRGSTRTAARALRSRPRRPTATSRSRSSRHGSWAATESDVPTLGRRAARLRPLGATRCSR